MEMKADAGRCSIIPASRWSSTVPSVSLSKSPKLAFVSPILNCQKALNAQACQRFEAL